MGVRRAEAQDATGQVQRRSVQDHEHAVAPALDGEAGHVNLNKVRKAATLKAATLKGETQEGARQLA